MSLTRNFWKTVADRVKGDMEFGIELVAAACGEIETEADYESARFLLESLMEEVDDTGDERLLVVIDALSEAVGKYEKREQLLDRLSRTKSQAVENWSRDDLYNRSDTMRKVVSVTPKAGYNLELVFNDGLQGVLCIKDLLSGPVFEPLKDEATFAQVRVEEHFRGICWPNGADLCPDSLYAEVIAGKGQAEPDEIDMKKEYDFSEGERGRFYSEDIELNLPDDFEPDMPDDMGDDRQQYVRKLIAGVRKQASIDPETIEACEAIGRSVITSRWIDINPVRHH